MESTIVEVTSSGYFWIFLGMMWAAETWKDVKTGKALDEYTVKKDKRKLKGKE